MARYLCEIGISDILVGGLNHLEKYEFVNGKDYPIYDGIFHGLSPRMSLLDPTVTRQMRRNIGIMDRLACTRRTRGKTDGQNSDAVHLQINECQCSKNNQAKPENNQPRQS